RLALMSSGRPVNLELGGVVTYHPDRNIPDDVYAMATRLLDSGEADVAVERRLVDAGVGFETARGIIAEHRCAAAAAQKSGGRTDLQFGAIAAFGGVTVMAIAGASSFLGWLGMIVGAMSVLSGLYKQRALRPAGG